MNEGSSDREKSQRYRDGWDSTGSTDESAAAAGFAGAAGFASAHSHHATVKQQPTVASHRPIRAANRPDRRYDDEMDVNKLSIRTDVLGRPLREALTLASRYRAAAVELDARQQVRPSDFSDTAIRQLRKMLDDRNLRISSLRFQTRRGYDVAEDLERRVESTKAVMKLAHRLGTSLVVNSIGRIPDADDAAAASFTQVMDDLGRFGAKAGAFLAIETGMNAPQDLRRVLDECEDGFLAVVLNPGRLIVNRHDVREATRVLGDRIAMLAAQDGVLDLAENRGVMVPLGQGIADFPSLLGELEARGFDGPFLVGRPGAVDAIPTELEYLRRIR